jgi:hypothetical protein
MSQGIAVSDLVDLQRTTLANLPQDEFEVALRWQNYVVINQWFKSEKVQIGSGTEIKRNIMLDHNGNARHVRLYQKTPVNIGDTQHQITAPWCFAQTHYAMDRREIQLNRGPAGFIKLMKARRLDATISLAEMLDERGWLAPNNASDTLLPRGLPYWLSKAGTTGAPTTDNATTGGFVGQVVRWAGEGFSTSLTTPPTTKGGIDAAAQSRWRNWVFTFATINNEFVNRLRRAFHSCRFQSPITVQDLKDDASAFSRYKMYTGLENLVTYEDLVSKSNDNLGADVGKFHGITAFNRVPVMYVPKLDDDSTDKPWYGVNHAHFYPYTLEGEWMRTGDPFTDVEQHNVTTSFIDCAYNYFCDNVRMGGFVAHVA